MGKEKQFLDELPVSARLILVTGGTRGIGAAIVQAFWESGCFVIATGTHFEEIDRLDAEQTERMLYLQSDFSDEKSLRALCDFISRLERLDVLVNNAGINIIKELEDVSSSDYDLLQNVNTKAPYLLSQAAAKVMRRQQAGWIVNIGSIWSVVTKSKRTLYTMAKSGLVGMTRAMAVELASDGILVNCLSPGFVMTDMTRTSLSADEKVALEKQIPLGRFATPGEIAGMAVFLGSKDNSYLTGQNIVVDGGFVNV